MVKSSISSENEACCSKSCKKNTDSLNSKIIELTDKLGDRENMLFYYKLALAQVEERLAEYKNRELKYYEKIRVLEFQTESKANCIECLTKDLVFLKKEKGELETKVTGFQTASKDLDSLLESQRLDKNKEGLGYSAVPPPPAQIYSPPKKDMSWTGLPEFADDTITDYSRPTPTIEGSPNDLQNKIIFVIETGASDSTISSKPFIKFVKAADRPTEDKTDKVETTRKPTVKYVKLYRRTSKSSIVRGNQRKWNNLKSQQLGRACLKNNNTHKSMPPKAVVHKTVRSPTRTNKPNMNVAQPRRTNFPKTKHLYVRRPFQETTQDLMIILIQRVKMLEKELKARTSPTKVHKVDRGRSRLVMAWVPKKEVIVNGNLPSPKRTVDAVEQSYPPTTAEEKLARKNELKARGTLLITLPNKHQLKFNSYKNAKSLMEAIEKWLQKLISQLEFHGETISQEDMNMKLLRSLPSEWKTHTLIWRNKPDLETLIMDDFSCSTNQAYGSNSANTDSLSDVVIYSFFAYQSNSPQLDNEDLQQIDANDLEEIDLKRQMAMLTIRARRFLRRLEKKVGTNGSDTIRNRSKAADGYVNHKSQKIPKKTGKKVGTNGSETIRALRENKNREPVRRNVTVETTDANALVAQDGFVYDRGDQAEDGPINFTLMAYTSLSYSSSSNSDTEFNVGAYKAGLESIEARLDVYKKNEAVFEEGIKILKLDIMFRDNALIELRKKFEKAKKERDNLKHTLEKFENSSKNLSKLNFMPPKPDLILADVDEYVVSESVTSVHTAATNEAKTSESKPKLVSKPIIEDWVSDCEDENETETKSKQRKPSFTKVEFVKPNEQVKSPREYVKQSLKEAIEKRFRGNKESKKVQKTLLKQQYENFNGNSSEGLDKIYDSLQKLISQLEIHRETISQEDLNLKLLRRAYKAGLESVEARLDVYKKNEAVFEEDIKILKIDIMFRDNALTELRKKFKKAKIKRDDLKLTLEKFENLSKNQGKLLDSQVNDMYKTGKGYHVVPPPYTGNFMPPKPDLILVDMGEYVVSETVTSVPTVATNEAKTGESKPKSISEPIIEDWVSDSDNENETETKSKQRKPSFTKVEFVKPNEKVKTHREIIKHEEHNKQAKHPRKNSQSPRDIECIVLSSNFKLHDESQVLLRVPTKNNMYSVDLKNVAPSGGLTCLFAKATLDESNLWHMRLEDINFKTMNKLVRGNLVRDPLGKFDGKADEGFFIGYSVNSKAFRVFNSRTRIVEEILYITFLKNKPNVAGSRPTWLFDIKTLTKTINYKPIVAGNQSNGSTGKARVETVPDKDYILLPLWTQDPLLSSSSKDSLGDRLKPSRDVEKKDAKDIGNKDNEVLSIEEPRVNQEKNANVNSTNNINAVSQTDNVDDTKDNTIDKNIIYGCADDLNIPNLEEIVYSDDDEDVGADADITNLDTNILVSPIRTTKFHKDHPTEQVIGDIHSAPQTKRMTNNVTNHGFEDPEFPDRFYKVEKALYGLHQAPRAWKEMCTEFEKMMHKKFQLSSMGKLTFFLGLQVAQKDDGIFIGQDKIFRYLKGQPKLGLWYPKDSPFNLEAYIDSDYADASLDRKSTIGEYVVASNYCGQVLWIQNQMLDYGYNFMNTKMFIDNESTICIVNNPVFHSKNKHIKIRHHFIRDSYEKRLIQVIKIHINHNVADLLTKAFDVSRFHYLIATAKDRIKVNTCNLSVNAVGHYLVLSEIVDFLNANPIKYALTERGDKVEMAATTAASLDAEQESGTINRTQSMAIPNEPIPQEDASNQGRNDQDEGISFVQDDAKIQGSAPNTTADVSVSTVEPSTPPPTTTIVNEDEDLIIAQTLMKMRKAIEEKVHIKLDEKVSRNLEAQLQAKLKDEERLARQKEEEANIALIAEWYDVQAMMDADHMLAERLQAKEQGELTIEERAQGNSKRARKELESHKSKKQKLDEKVEAEKDNDQEAEMKMYMKIVFDDEVAIDDITLAIKPAFNQVMKRKNKIRNALRLQALETKSAVAGSLCSKAGSIEPTKPHTPVLQ
nr:hypothetical protein [Tanacetum cinerariifolium]